MSGKNGQPLYEVRYGVGEEVVFKSNLCLPEGIEMPKEGEKPLALPEGVGLIEEVVVSPDDSGASSESLTPLQVAAGPFQIMGDMAWEVIKDGTKAPNVNNKSFAVLSKADPDALHYQGARAFRSPKLSLEVSSLVGWVTLFPALTTGVKVEYWVEGFVEATYAGGNPDVPVGKFIPRVVVNVDASQSLLNNVDVNVRVSEEIVNVGEPGCVVPNVNLTVEFKFHGIFQGKTLSNDIQISGEKGYVSSSRPKIEEETWLP